MLHNTFGFSRYILVFAAGLMAASCVPDSANAKGGGGGGHSAVGHVSVAHIGGTHVSPAISTPARIPPAVPTIVPPRPTPITPITGNGRTCNINKEKCNE